MERSRWRWRGSPSRAMAAALLVATIGGMGRLSLDPPARTHAAAVCTLSGGNGPIKHVIYLQFDNFHFKRDVPNVPSDLEQLPALLSFMKSNGVFLTNHHTTLISHTADDFITSFTGLYGDRHGVATSHNSYRYWNPDGSTSSTIAFKYWTDPGPHGAGSPNPNPNLIEETRSNNAGINNPAPWVPYTRSGCDFGAVGGANLVVENNNNDISTIFGTPAFGPSDPTALGEVNTEKGYADFVGIGVHCAQGSAICAAAGNTVRNDPLPDEPAPDGSIPPGGGYQGYQAVFGHRYVAPLISCSGNTGQPCASGTNALAALSGTVITDPSLSAYAGFPGFDQLTPDVSLGYVAAMQEHGIPVTYAYLTNAHNLHPAGIALGPGSQQYEAQLQAFETGFENFFARLAADGINKSNTLFVFTTDEEDKFAGTPNPSPAGCDGVTVFCTYTNSQIGELTTQLNGLTAQAGNSTPFRVQNDVAPSIYVKNRNPHVSASTPPVPVDETTLGLANTLSTLTNTNLYTGETDQIVQRMADTTEMKLLHMVTADPARTPSLNLFANDFYWLVNSNPSCSGACVTNTPPFAWIHGSYQADITNNWLGFVGPGIRTIGQTGGVFTDEADINPTMRVLLGQRNDYVTDGRAILNIFEPTSTARLSPLRIRAIVDNLGAYYKQINAPLGTLGQLSLKLDTLALEGSVSRYLALQSRLENILDRRTALARRIAEMLTDVEARGGVPSISQYGTIIVYTRQASDLLNEIRSLTDAYDIS